MFSDESWLLQRMGFLIPLVLSLTVHEWAHAWAAAQLGDDTAARQGRLTLNPVPHIDPIGTLILPLLGIPFGWAKPVPINIGRFRRGVSVGAGVAITAVAGPLSNLVLALVALILGAVLAAVDPSLVMPGTAIFSLLEIVVLLNILLALFNLIPVPPLDGSRIVDGLLPGALRPAWDRFVSLGPLGLVLVIALPVLAGVSLFALPMQWARALLRFAVG